MSDEAKQIVFEQLLSLFIYPERPFLQSLDEVFKDEREENDSIKQSREKLGARIKLYREGYLTGLATQMIRFEEDEKNSRLLADEISFSFGFGSIGRMDTRNMHMFSYAPLPEWRFLTKGFSDGRDQAAKMIWKAVREVMNIRDDYLEKQDTSREVSDLSDAEKKQILSQSKKYEAVLFLRGIINDKMKTDKGTIQAIIAELDRTTRP